MGPSRTSKISKSFLRAPIENLEGSVEKAQTPLEKMVKQKKEEEIKKRRSERRDED